MQTTYNYKTCVSVLALSSHDAARAYEFSLPVLLLVELAFILDRE